MKRLPAWIGWYGPGAPPGREWLPGPSLRWCAACLVGAFIALGLTVNYAASAAFFLLAIAGLYVGFRKGFIAGQRHAERLVLLALAVYPLVAIVSFIVGVQTNVGFRFLGRDLRFLLFVPVYLALRWSRIRVRPLGWTFACGAVGCLILAILQTRPWPAPKPSGVAGTHIIFGDLSLLTGFIAAALLWPIRCDGTEPSGPAGRSDWAGVVVALGAGLAASVLAQSRGAWLAAPFLAGCLALLLPGPRRIGWRVRVSALTAVILLGGAVAWAVPAVRGGLGLARAQLAAYLTVGNARMVDAPCVDDRRFLEALLRFSHRTGPGRVEIVRLGATQRRAIARFGCRGAYALSIRNSSVAKEAFRLGLYRGGDLSGKAPQRVSIIASGAGSFNVGWKPPWSPIHSAGAWRRYEAEHSYQFARSANIRVQPGQQILVVPIQTPRGAFAYPLARTSVGQRLEMWRAAWALFRSHPLLGAGTGSFRALAREALANHAGARIAGDYEHAHSDYFDSLGTKGLLGFLAFIAVILAPVLGTRSLACVRSRSRYVTAATLLATGYSVFALTETVFVHSLAISWYAVTSAVLLAGQAATPHAQDRERSTKS